ncbi:MAG: hypothetical protein WCO67_20390 [Betaproteobacteria bacterium]
MHTVRYERRRPEETILHCLVREHLETFLAQVQAKTGTGLPEFVKDEFEAFLECGILARGFLRVYCADCALKRTASGCMPGHAQGLRQGDCGRDRQVGAHRDGFRGQGIVVAKNEMNMTRRTAPEADLRF